MSVWTKSKIQSELKKLPSLEKKAEFLIGLMKLSHKEITGDAKKFVESELKKVLKEKAKVTEYVLEYDTFGEGLEPIYYWILDFLRDQLGYEVEKSADWFHAAAASGWFGEMGARRTALEKQAMELLGKINVVVKSIIRLLWDLRELKLRLENYEKYFNPKNEEEKKEADWALKGIFLTEVDVKKGRAALNVLATDLNFVTIRDAFMVAQKPEDVDKMDLNDRVKRILKPRVAEYLNWVKMSYKELKKRFDIEKAYLKSQVNSLRYYTMWARPYLIAIGKLLPKEELYYEPDVVSTFNVMQAFITLLARKKVNGKYKLPKPKTVYACIELQFNYRVSPGTVERGTYLHRGKATIRVIPCVYTEEELTYLKDIDMAEVLRFVQDMTQESIDAMIDDLKEFLGEEFQLWASEKFAKEEVKEKKIKIPVFAKKEEKLDPFLFKKALQAAKTKAKKNAWTLIDTFKKAHKMLTW